MAYEILEGAILEVAAEYMVNGQQCINLFHYRFVSGPDIADGRAGALSALSILDGTVDLMNIHAACISSLAGTINWYAQWIYTLRYAYVTWPDGPLAAAGPNTMQPVNVGAAITKKGQVANRHNVGSIHMGGVPTPWVVASMITPTGLAVYNTLADAIIQPFVLPTTQEFQPILLNKAAPGSSVEIFEAFARDTSRVNRRRTVGVGV